MDRVRGRADCRRQDGGWCWWLRAAFAGRYGLVPFRLSLEDERNRGSSFLIFGVPSKTERGQLPATARDGSRQSGASGKGGTTNATIPDPPDPGTLSDQATEDTVTGRSCVPARENLRQYCNIKKGRKGMAKTHRRLFANTPPQITAETVRGLTMEGFAVDRGPATKGSHSWAEPLSPSAEDHEE
ncbi:predicted protein [Histoplasma capsulatum H143]|uniref:Uncharacterized protein n=1 Tax=Ajellomyces capsulatus (strain H143) TaxID=544712 RepID=C6HMC2_AJECH|nr:predicted protein [Histoplasma capsulatum H143]